MAKTKATAPQPSNPDTSGQKTKSTETNVTFGIYNVSKGEWDTKTSYPTAEEATTKLADLPKATSNTPGEKVYIAKSGDLLSVRRKT